MLPNDQRIRSAIAGGLGGVVSRMLIEPLVAPRLQQVTSVSEAPTALSSTGRRISGANMIKAGWTVKVGEVELEAASETTLRKEGII